MFKKIAGIFLFFCLTMGIYAGVLFSEVSMPVAGHSIKIDKDLSDWVGKVPAKENSSWVSGGEFVWKDAIGDDVGDGNYTYPKNAAFKRCADLKEFRVTFDAKNVYFLIRFETPGDYWAPYCVIGIDQDGASGGIDGSEVLYQGSHEEGGSCGELKVKPELACEYTIAVFSCYRGKIWNAKGELVGTRDGKESDTPGLIIDDKDWHSLEVAIPIKIIGNPAKKTWRFIVATGLEEQGHLREMSSETGEWNGGGGIGSAEEGEVDPDVFDLASPGGGIQKKELGSYSEGGEAGDEGSFATIKESFLTVKFGG